jgi:hypothetical protein
LRIAGRIGERFGKAPLLIQSTISLSTLLCSEVLAVFDEVLDMFYKISDRVRDEYGDGDNNSADALEPMAIISFVAIILIIVFAGVS